jgi:hypothetical protein
MMPADGRAAAGDPGSRRDDHAGAVTGAAPASAADPGDLAEVAFADLVRAPRMPSLTTPVAGAATLPLGELDPEVLERLAAEMIKRRLNDGAHFYGRRGQKQYGLDIVEREIGGRVTVYQVRRYAVLTPDKITEAVSEYADPQPPKPGVPPPGRRFAAGKYVLLTSAPFEDDTALRDRLAELQEKYDGDLVIDVWGREKVSGELRDSGALVNSVFGAEWARQFCGFAPPPPPAQAPDRLGLIDDPVQVIEGLDALASDARAREATAPLEAARLYGMIADTLEEASFPSHAAAQRAHQGQLLKDGGDAAAAFTVLWGLARAHLTSGEASRALATHHALDELRPVLDQVQAARLDALQAAQDWYEQGSWLASAVPALEALREAADPYAPLLACLVLEQAVTDGWYDFDPPAALVDPGGNDRDLLDRLLGCAAGLSSTDVVLRARLHCAHADALLRAGSAPADVEAAFAPVMRNTGTGRYRDAEGLAAARAARAFAVHGDPARAIDLWRKSILLASESRLYGDVVACRLAINSAAFEKPRPDLADLGVAGPLPNEDRLLAAAHSAQLEALGAAHAGKLPDAFGVARRCLWEARIAGQYRDERAAMELFGDIMLAAGRPGAAVTAWVMAGAADKAARHAPSCTALLDMTPWAASPTRHRQAAAARVIGAQASLYRGERLESAMHQLLGLAAEIWGSLRVAPNPAFDAVNALCRFGGNLPGSAVDPVVELLAPALAPGRTLLPETVSLLIQVYWAAPGRRGDLAAIIAAQLSRDDPPPTLWGFVSSLPLQAREPLAAAVSAMAGQGSPPALLALAAWQVPTLAVQAAARRACADILREPPPTLLGTWPMSSRYCDAAVLLAALAGAGTAADADPRDLRPGRGEVLLSRVLVTMGLSVASPPAGPAPVPAPAAGAAASPVPAGHEPGSWEPDQAAITAAGRPAVVITAAAERFLVVAGSRQVPAFARTDAVMAIRGLVPHLPATAAGEAAGRLLEIAQDPDLNEFDEAELLSQDPLSRGRLDTGAGQLPAVALLTAAEAAEAAGRAAGGLPPGRMRELAVRAAVLLRSPDPTVAGCGAAALARASRAEPSLAGFATALVTHPGDQVRKAAAALAPLDETAQQILVTDPAPEVRATLGHRAPELLPEIWQRLLADPHPDVREAAAAPGDGPRSHAEPPGASPAGPVGEHEDA